MTYLPLLPGETPVAHAPEIPTSAGDVCIPQHYLAFDHTLETVEHIASRIEFSDRYPIFVSEDQGGLFIQIGVIGPDNYKTEQSEKIVFGRRWRVERNLPSSEIIQTIFLAIKKAREHEIREQFLLRHDGTKTTPFNNHHDLPLMAHLSEELYARQSHDAGEQSLFDLIGSVSFDGVSYRFLAAEELLDGRHAVTVSTMTARPEYLEVYGSDLSFIVPDLSANTILHNLMNEFIRLSDRHIDETFRFDGFARFSHDVSPFEIADMSATFRKSPKKFMDPEGQTVALLNSVQSLNYETDASRIPLMSKSAYANSLRANLEKLGVSLSPAEGLAA